MYARSYFFSEASRLYFPKATGGNENHFVVMLMLPEVETRQAGPPLQGDIRMDLTQ